MAFVHLCESVFRVVCPLVEYARAGSAQRLQRRRAVAVIARRIKLPDVRRG